MFKLALPILFVILLTACATTPEGSTARLERADAVADAAVSRYCALHPAARAVIRAQLTAGVPVIDCE